MGFWSGKRVMVTGGAGFLGRHVVERLRRAEADIFVPRKRDYDFTNPADALRCLNEHPADIVIHAAAYYGGIGINQTQPARIFYENVMMGVGMMEAARRTGVRKFVTIGTACSYPGYLDGDLKEADLWAGPLHDSVVNYGLTKKLLAVQGSAYAKQYGFDSIHLILTNLYGPHDCYRPERSHVVAALIRKWVEATENAAPSVEVWGTGRPVREFIYVEDAADAILRAAERYDDPKLPLNIGTGVGTSIRALVETIHTLTRFDGEIAWDDSKPDGTGRKVLDVTRMTQALDWTPPTSLEAGLKKTIDWYRANKADADAKR